jgi:hypothetical protein
VNILEGFTNGTCHGSAASPQGLSVARDMGVALPNGGQRPFLPANINSKASCARLNVHPYGLQSSWALRPEHRASTVQGLASIRGASNARDEIEVQERSLPLRQAKTADLSNGVSLDDTIEEDERVVTTFRWPAALAGEDVSVLGARSDCRCVPQKLIVPILPCSATNDTPCSPARTRSCLCKNH